MDASNYELMVVTRSGDGDSMLSKIEQMVKDAQAASVNVQKLGKKNLAYPIKKQTEAEFALINFEAEGEAVKVISDGLRLEQESLLRYLITRVKERKAKQKARATKEVKVQEEEKTPETKVRSKKTVKVIAKSAKVKGKSSKN